MILVLILLILVLSTWRSFWWHQTWLKEPSTAVDGLLLRCLSWAAHFSMPNFTVLLLLLNLSATLSTTTIEVSRHIVFSMKIFEGVASSLKDLASFSDLQNQSESLRLLPKLLSRASYWRFQAPLPPQCRSPRANEWHDRISGADHRIAVGGMCHCHLHQQLVIKDQMGLSKKSGITKSPGYGQ